MTDTPWLGDACSLVDAFRSGERSPVEELQASLAAIDRSRLNAFSFLDPEQALAAARTADTTKPFGGVPTGIKELEAVEGWPDTGGSLVFKDQIADHTSTGTARLRDAGGAVFVGLTTSSEFGGLNVSVTKLNGVTHNPWQHGRTVGGSSSGSSSAVAGGLVSLANGSDGGGSIRIPAGYTGLLGMKGTFGRIPRGPEAFSRPNTVVHGCLARSVRDAARYYDVCAGFDSRDPLSLPAVGNWEAGLGTHELAGLRVAVIPALGGVTLEDGVEARIRAHASDLIAATGMVEVDLQLDLTNVTAEWMLGNVSTLLAVLGDRWPGCADQMTDAVQNGLRVGQTFYNLKTAAIAEAKRLALNEQMAAAFDKVDLIIAATNPGPAFNAEHETSNPLPPNVERLLTSAVGRGGLRGALAAIRVAGGVAPSLPGSLLEAITEKVPDMVNMGALTIVSNIYGNPAVSIPAGLVHGLPVGMQVLATHHADALLFDVSLAAERELPWPLVADGVAPAAPSEPVSAGSSAR